MDDPKATRRREAAASYDRVAEQHEQTAAFHRGLGDDERAELELRIAAINRDAAKAERELADAVQPQ